MARNASGTHSLPAGNPVISGTPVSSSTQNTTMSDISAEITDSLSRSGKGAMTAPLELYDGTVGTPGLSFDSDADCGLYRIGANHIGVAVSGAKVVDVATTGLGVTGTLSATGVTSLADGAVGTPGLNFTSDTDSGMYRIGANNVGVAVNGAKVLDVATTGLTVTGTVTATGNVPLTGSSPASTTGFTSTVTPSNICKAWGTATTNGSGSVVMTDGFNVASVGFVGSTAVAVTIANDMADTKYCVVTTCCENAYFTYVTGKAAGSFNVVTRTDAGSTVDPTATSLVLHFIVYGKQ